MNIVIAGFGVAGATAAEIARKTNPKAYITLFSRENDLFYYRLRLPEVVSGSLSPEKVIVHPKSWYDERKIELRLGESLLEVNRDEKILRGSTGSRQQYDRLLLAVGAECNRPSFPGDKLDGIHTVRTLNDAWGLALSAKGKARAVLIGGGLLGLELGYSLTRQGVAVTVLEKSGRVLPRQTTPAGSEILRRQLEALGLEFKLNCQADRFEGTRKVRQVVLNNGQDLATDLVLISAGIQPNLNLAASLGLKIDQAVLVDEYLQTSHPDIYAAGDCAQFPGSAGGLWTTARAQGLVAGANLAAETPAGREKYIPEAPSNTLKVAGIDLVAAGNLDPDNLLKGIEAIDQKVYRKVVLDSENRLVGFTNIGTTRGNRELNEGLAAKKVIDAKIEAGLAGLDFDFAGF